MDDQGISLEEPQSRVLRLALLFFGALFGLFLLSFAFGSSSASADDGSDSPETLGSAVGGLVSSVTDPVSQTLTAVTHAVQPVTKPVTQAPAVKPVTDAVAAVAHTAPVASVTAPIAGLVDGALTKILGDSPLGSAIGPQPVGSILIPVSDLLDGTVADASEGLAPPSVTGGVVAAMTSTGPVIEVTLAAATALVSGVADGHLVLHPAVTPGGHGAAGLSAAGSSMFAAIAGAGFLVLLMMRRTTLVDREMPGSPVFDTDSSPD